MCLHLFFIGLMSGGTEPSRTTQATRPASSPIIVALLPAPRPSMAPDRAPSSAEAPQPSRAEKPASPQRKPAPGRRASPPSHVPSAQPLTGSPSVEASQAPSAIAPDPAPSTSQPSPLTLTLPGKTTGFATFGQSNARTSANELHQQIQSRIEAQRVQESAQSAVSNQAPARIVERVHSDGSRSARVDSNWGSYCLNTPRHHVHGDPRMPANTVVPTTCP